MSEKPKKPKPEDVETEPDAWERFQKVMDKIVPPRKKEKKESEDRRPKSGQQEGEDS